MPVKTIKFRRDIDNAESSALGSDVINTRTAGCQTGVWS